VADVLVVEAEDLTRRLLEVRLTDAGHRVLAASSRAHALELVDRAGCPEVLVTALSLPDGGAPELVARLRADPGSADLPVLVLSGQALPDDVEAVRALGASLLTKPFSAEALTDALTAVLAPLDSRVEQTVRARLAGFGVLEEYERDLIAELMTAFVQRAPATSFAAERASATGDPDALRSAVGRLAVAARNLGAGDLAVLCAEVGAHDAPCPMPPPLAARFRRVLGATCRVFARLAAEFGNDPADTALAGVGRG
jgi:two-component system, OmpR family, response regulator MtrA